MSYLKEVTGFARFVGGRWQPMYTTSSVGVKTIEIGGNSPMPSSLYAAFVTDLATYMTERESLWKNFPSEQSSPEIGVFGTGLH